MQEARVANPIGHEIPRLERATERPGTFVRPNSKRKRNEPCPCGSGVKFKKCCLIGERRREGARRAAVAVVQDPITIAKLGLGPRRYA